ALPVQFFRTVLVSFSSRRRHTRFSRDWSSDVCSSDLGSDKPDLRFGVELTDLTEYFANTSFRVFQASYVGAVVMPGGASQPRKQLDAWQEWAKQRGARGLAYVLVDDDGAVSDRGPVVKNLSE